MKFFKRKKKAKKDIFEQSETNLKNIDVLEEHEFVTTLIYASDAVNTVYPACASCYNISTNKNTKYEERLGYIGRRVKSSHTSILEHDNILLQVFVPLKETENLFDIVTKYNEFIKPELSDQGTSDQDIMTMISEVRDVCRYLTIYTDTIKDKKDNPILRMTIGGSIRGFRYIFENIENRHNKLFVSIFNVLKLVIPQEFFIDFINDRVMDSYNTIEITNDLKDNVSTSLAGYKSTEYIDILNRDNLIKISNMLKLPKEKCFDFVSITVDFKKMSRIITQQVTRHRNGITQESQRYVNYTGASFNSPDKFKDKYDQEKTYITPVGKVTLQELGNRLSNIYGDLVHQGIDKEDARGYLPQNIQCGNLYMTFTLRTLFAFLQLRLDPHAQAEVNRYAQILADMTQYYADSLNLDDMETASRIYYSPIYFKNDIDNDSYYTEIDEKV